MTLEEDLAAITADQQTGSRGTTNAGLTTTSKEENSVTSDSSGFGSLTKKKAGGEVVGLGGLTDSGTAESSGGGYDAMIESMSTISDLANAQSLQSGMSSSTGLPLLASTDHGHSRNSSNTSQVRDRAGLIIIN